MSCVRVRNVVSRAGGEGRLNLAIIICTNSRYSLLEKALASALMQGDSVDEIIVVDNSPDRDRAEAFARGYSSLRQVHFAFEEIQNLSHARNVGIALAHTDIVAFIDDDAVAEPNWAKALIKAFATGGADAGCVGGPVKPIWTSAPPTWLTPALAGYFSILDLGDRQKELSRGDWLAGCNIAFNRQALLSIGGFRTDIGRTGNKLCLMSNEEAAAWQKLKRAGKKVLYSPDAIVSHHINEDRLNNQWLSRRIAWQAVSDVISDPELASRVADSGARFVTARVLLSIAARLLSRRYQRPLSDGEANALYRLVVVLLSRGIESFFSK